MNELTTSETRCRAKPDISPPGCATSLLPPATPISCVDKKQQKLFATDRKTTFRLITYCSYSSTNTDNLAKISPATFEIMITCSLTGIVQMNE